MLTCYSQTRYNQRMWETIKAQEWEKTYHRWLGEYRRMVQYHLQWGTPTGPYWAPIPSQPWWVNGGNWNQHTAMAIGTPPYNTSYIQYASNDCRHKLLIR